MRKTKILGLVFLLSITVVPAAVFAQDRAPNADQIKTRIAERKNRLKIKLDAAGEKRVKDRCGRAQAKVESFLTKAREKSSKRDQKYAEFSSRVDQIVAKLQSEGKNVAALNQALQNAKNQQDTIAKAYQDQITALEDLSKMDCASDPAGFKAALQDARNHSAGLKKARAGQQKAVKADLKQALQTALGSN